MDDSYTVLHKKFNPTDPRLGRHVRHDSRSLFYQVEPTADLASLKSVRHIYRIPTLDQGSLGSCTGNASAGCLGAGLFWPTIVDKEILSATDAAVDETYAVGIYSEATKLDSVDGSYPPDDTGSDGLSVAKVLLSRGLISGYKHATSLEAVLTALAEQPVIVGTTWRKDMFNPDSDGRIRISGSVQGGHEYVLDELDVENKRVWMHNSWSEDWGIDGRAYYTWDDFKNLLADDGDCTVFTPLTQPAPKPSVDPKAEFLQAAQAWSQKNLKDPGNRKFQSALKKFLSWYSN